MTESIDEKLARRSARDPETGCLRWTGSHNPKGYGQVVYLGAQRIVHRLAYERAYGPIPDGLDVDHVRDRGCAYRDCIEPTHLEAVTHAENVARSTITHCKQGHEFTPENTYRRVNAKGYTVRSCRTCRRAWKRAWTARQGATS